MRRSARYLLACFLLSSLSAQLMSEDGSAITPNKWALQLKMPDLISTAPDWNGDLGSLYLLRKVSPHAALRIGAGLTVELPDESPPPPRIEDRLYDATGLTILDTPTKLRQVTFQVNALAYAPPSGQATLYFGLGPRVSIARDHRGPEFYTGRTMDMWSLGVEGVVGISVEIKSRFTLLAEYTIWIADKFTRYTYSDGSKIRTSIHSEKVQQTVPRSPIPLLGVSFSFK